MNCASCEYYDYNEKWGLKGYCTWYKTYYYPEDTCSHYKEAGSSSGGCFLTSACCSYKGFPDDCYELTSLRSFRDEYLRNTSDGRKMVDEYYSIAPSIVSAIEKQENKEKIYEEIYASVLECVKLIEDGRFEETTFAYKKMVADLSELYLND